MRLPRRRAPYPGIPPADGTVAWDAWALGWAGALGLAFLNGALHRVWDSVLPELTGDQLAAVVLLALIWPWATHVERVNPLGEPRDAVLMGLAWAGATVTFEFTFGRCVDKERWADLLKAYDLTAGRLWSLDVLGIAAAPALARWWNRRAVRPTAS
jgi:hypothetical protein